MGNPSVLPMNIEIMPVEKSCEQGCSHCPLSSKNNPINNKKIDKNVQGTFTLLENRLEGEGRSYNIHYTSKLALFPLLQHPNLIEMLRFETNRGISQEGAVNGFVTKIKKVITHGNIDPSHICFSFVPQGLLLDESEIKLIASIMKGLSSGFFDTNTNKKISCTIRSNFVPEKKYVSVNSKKDRIKMESILEIIGATTIDDNMSKVVRLDDDFLKLYGQSIVGTNQKGYEYEVSNRIIMHKNMTAELKEKILKKSDGILDLHIEQSIRSSAFDTHFLISPQGVMVNHSSDAINNPILWLTHADFDFMLTKYSDQSLEAIGKLILEQNMHLYYLLKDPITQQGLKTSDAFKEYLKYFQKFRPELIKNVESKKKKD